MATKVKKPMREPARKPLLDVVTREQAVFMVIGVILAHEGIIPDSPAKMTYRQFAEWLVDEHVKFYFGGFNGEPELHTKKFGDAIFKRMIDHPEKNDRHDLHATCEFIDDVVGVLCPHYGNI